MADRKTPSAFYRFRLKWMPFANLAIIGVAILVLLQLPYAEVHIIEPPASPTATGSTITEVGSPFTLRVYIDNTIGCDYQADSLRVVATAADGIAIPIQNLVLEGKEWVASNVNLPLGQYQLAVSVMAECEADAVAKVMNIVVACRPLTVAQAKVQGDVCGEYVADNCGGYVKLPSCIDFGVGDMRVNNPNLNCKQTGYYVGRSALTYVENGETRHYFAALKCGSGNNKECYEQPTANGSCKSSKSPEEFTYYGSKDDPAFHKCRIECAK